MYIPSDVVVGVSDDVTVEGGGDGDGRESGETLAISCDREHHYKPVTGREGVNIPVCFFLRRCCTCPSVV